MLKYLPAILLAALFFSGCDNRPGQTEEDVYGYWVCDYDKTIQYQEAKGFEPSDMLLYYPEDMAGLSARVDKESGLFTLTFQGDTPINAQFELVSKDDGWFLLTVPETDVSFLVKPLRRGELLMYPEGYPEQTTVMVKKTY